MPEILLKNIIILLVAVAALLSITSCDSVNDNRIPYADVHLTFHTVGDWNIYGVKADAAGHASYIKTPQLTVPADFPYTALDRTGYGGLLLVTDMLGDLHAYDLCCPVEVRPTVRIEIPVRSDGTFEAYAECPVCKSRYDVFMNRGNAMSGLAAERGYALQRYSVSSGGPTEYRVVTR